MTSEVEPVFLNKNNHFSDREIKKTCEELESLIITPGLHYKGPPVRLDRPKECHNLLLVS
jgi:hypothetical protein